MIKKVFVNKEQIATFSCSECGQAKQMDVSKYSNQNKEVKLNYKCKCNHSFYVKLERRRYVRKAVDLIGNLIRGRKRYSVKVEDLSRYGMKIKLLDRLTLDTEDKIEVEFTLDDPNRSVVKKEVVIKTVQPKTVGVKFSSSDHYDRFGKYLLFHFG